MTEPLCRTPPEAAGPRLLVVDDEESILRSLRRSLQRSTREVLTAGTGDAALALLEDDPDVHVIVSDYRMPGMNGVELLRQVKERWPRIQRIMLTGYADQRAIEDAINRSEVYRYVSKPWDDAQLQMTIASAWEQYRLVEENERLYREIQAHAADLEDKVQERTQLLSAAKAEWELSFDAIRDPLAVVDARWVVKRANRAWAEHSRLPIRQIPGATCHATLFGREQPCPNCNLQRVLAGEEPGVFTCRRNGQQYRANAYRLPEADGTGPRAIVYYRDVTEEEKLTRQLVQTEKMAAVGQLAGGVAHEINNPLAGILAFSQLMLAEGGRNDDDVEQLGYIESSARRAMRIVESLLSFSRSTDGDVRKPVDVRALFEELRVLSGTLVKGTAVEVLVEREPGPEAVANANQIQQVLVNLVTNAVQAVAKRGTVRVSAGPGVTGLRFAVEDSGPGVPPEVARHIFDPFFTTKPEGQGTGLGLAISYRLVEAHGGRLTVGTSRRLGGASFSFELPAQIGDAHE